MAFCILYINFCWRYIYYNNNINDNDNDNGNDNDSDSDNANTNNNCKYKELTEEIRQVWQQQEVHVMPLIFQYRRC